MYISTVTICIHDEYIHHIYEYIIQNDMGSS